MNGNTYLAVALIVAGVGALLWYTGPVAHRWHAKLEKDLDRKRRELNISA